MGGYEPNPQSWTTRRRAGRWQFQLFDDDWDHFEQHMGQAIARVPALEKAGIKQMINGPESFTPDGNFILGLAPECPNMFVGAGFNAFGIASGGGAGWVLAQWVVDGEAPLDLWVVDIRRFSDLHRDRDWVRDRTLEAYGKHYTIAFPHEEYEVRAAAHRLAALRAAEGTQARCSARSSAGSGRTGLRRRASSPRMSTRWAGRTGSTRSASEHRPRARGGRHLRPVVLCQIRNDRQGCAEARSTGSAPTTSTSRPAGSPTPSC